MDDLEDLRGRCERSLNWNGTPSAADLIAAIPTDLGVDRYGKGGAVEAIEARICELLGKPAAVFMMSGTMAQQIAIRIYADRAGVRTFGFHPTCHLELHEDKAYQRLHSLIGLPTGGERSLLTLDDLASMTEPLAAFLFELPQREIGGRLPDWPDLEEQVAHVRARGVAVHLDGARLWECTPYYNKTPAEIAGLFDSVYVSFYKGLGALAGCCLAGEADVIAQARAWRTRHGGTLFGMWPNAASAMTALDTRLPLFPRYYQHALAVAGALKGVEQVEVVPDPPQTPMMHLHLRVAEEQFLTNARRIAEDKGIFTWPRSYATDTPSIRRVELTVGDATMTFPPEEIAKIVEDLVG
jgi:threonine aldolase